MTAPEKSQAHDVDVMLLSAAQELIGSGQTKFMDIDMVRIAYGRADAAPVDDRAVVDSLVRLCRTGQLVAFVDGVIIRALLRGPRRNRPKPGTTAAQVINVLGPGNQIAEDGIIALVRRRNVLLSFTVPAAAEQLAGDQFE